MATEYLQFAGALGILIGSYWFVYVPNQRRTMKLEAGVCGLPGSVS